MASSTTIWYYVGLAAGVLLLLLGIVMIILGVNKAKKKNQALMAATLSRGSAPNVSMAGTPPPVSAGVDVLTLY